MPRPTASQRIATLEAKARAIEVQARRIRLQPMISAERKLRDAALALPEFEAALLLGLAQKIADHVERPVVG